MITVGHERIAAAHPDMISDKVQLIFASARDLL
jgi:hypothetical protein